MNTDLKDILPKLNNALAWLKRHQSTIIVLVIAGMYGFLILQINLLNKRQPSETAVQEQIKNIKRPNVSEQTANKLKALEDTSQETKALFQAARENPFLE